MNSIRNLNSSGRPTLSKFLFLAVSLMLIVSLGVAQAQAKATTVTNNFTQPLDLLVFVPCAALGAGEFVHLTGTLHILFVDTIDGNGGVHSEFHFQPQGVSGTGLITGDKYNAVGETRGTFNARVGSEFTFVDNFRVIGQGPGNNFQVHENVHVTFLADGTLTANVDNFSVVCKIPNYP
jgi:hypothetical protein